MGIDLVLFDCDGVLVDSEPLTTRVIVDHVGRLGLQMDLGAALRRFKGGRLADVIRDVEAELGHAVPDDFVQRFRADLVVRLAEAVEPIDGILEAVAALRWPTCVASNGPHSKMDASLRRVGLLDHFAGRIFSAYDIGSFKPDPGLFLHAARTLRADPARCVVVEDSAGGVRAGVAAGMTVLAYAAHGDAAHLREAGGQPFDEMSALPTLLDTLAAIKKR